MHSYKVCHMHMHSYKTCCEELQLSNNLLGMLWASSVLMSGWMRHKPKTLTWCMGATGMELREEPYPKIPLPLSPPLPLDYTTHCNFPAAAPVEWRERSGSNSQWLYTAGEQILILKTVFSLAAQHAGWWPQKETWSPPVAGISSYSSRTTGSRVQGAGGEVASYIFGMSS